ncbi:MAG: hypothetical protein K8U03_23200 [Planctomycetia bacterium]|nr:hypothetical protein [Planctomycetia bacterium]
MSTAELVRKPLKIARRACRIRDSWGSEERSRRAQLAAQGLRDLVAQITSNISPADVWAIGSLTPADLRRLSA